MRLLPRRQRDDVANELRSLVLEELSSRIRETGQPPDPGMALSLVRGCGQPNEVATSRSFASNAIACYKLIPDIS